jgi:hypothetical protein
MAGLVIFALGGYGTARGDCWPVEGNNTKLLWEDRREGDRGEEIYVDLEGEALRELRKKLELLEGERDRDRRSWRMAELAST